MTGDSIDRFPILTPRQDEVVADMKAGLSLIEQQVDPETGMLPSGVALTLGTSVYRVARYDRRINRAQLGQHQVAEHLSRKAFSAMSLEIQAQNLLQLLAGYNANLLFRGNEEAAKKAGDAAPVLMGSRSDINASLVLDTCGMVLDGYGEFAPSPYTLAKKIYEVRKGLKPPTQVPPEEGNLMDELIARRSEQLSSFFAGSNSRFTNRGGAIRNAVRSYKTLRSSRLGLSIPDLVVAHSKMRAIIPPVELSPEEKKLTEKVSGKMTAYVERAMLHDSELATNPVARLLLFMNEQLRGIDVEGALAVYARDVDRRFKAMDKHYRKGAPRD